MKTRCQKRTDEIRDGFMACRTLLTALGDDTRILVLIAILQGDAAGVRVGEIAKQAHITRASASHHLQVLMENEIVAQKKDGTKNYYFICSKEEQWGKLVHLSALIQEAIHSQCAQRKEGE